WGGSPAGPAAGCGAPPAERAGSDPAWAAGARLLVGAPVRAELVVLLAFGGIAEHFIGFVDLLEARLGRLVARVDVGVMLPRQLPVGLLDFLLGRGLRHAERRVVVLEVHEQSAVSVVSLSRSRACGSADRVPGSPAAARRAPTAHPPASAAAGAARPPRFRAAAGRRRD